VYFSRNVNLYKSE